MIFLRDRFVRSNAKNERIYLIMIEKEGDYILHKWTKRI